jgi:hypothetical protein
MNIFGEGTTDEVYTFCKRELIQAIWKLLLDGDFMHAYEHGIVIHCSDGVTRRIFPRFFTYSADYPEKFVRSFLKPFPSTHLFITGSFSRLSSFWASVCAHAVSSRNPMFPRWVPSSI